MEFLTHPRAASRTGTNQTVCADFGFQPSSCFTSSAVRILFLTAISHAAQRCAGSPRISPDKSISSLCVSRDAPKILRLNSDSILRIQGESVFCANQRKRVSTLLNVPYCRSPIIGGGTLNSLASASTVKRLDARNSASSGLMLICFQ
jgi:hypothetical protein